MPIILNITNATRDHKESVNKTQDYAYGDFSIARIAEHLGKDELAEEFYERSLYYRNIFNTEKTFMLSKDKEGKERDDWTQFDWGGGLTPRAALGRIPLPFSTILPALRI